jgi:hypothetical protein
MYLYLVMLREESQFLVQQFRISRLFEVSPRQSTHVLNETHFDQNLVAVLRVVYFSYLPIQSRTHLIWYHDLYFSQHLFPFFFPEVFLGGLIFYFLV